MRKRITDGEGLPESTWSKISAQASRLKYFEQISRAMIQYPGRPEQKHVDDLTMMKHSCAVQHLYSEAMSLFKEKFFKDCLLDERDTAMMENSMANLIGNIVGEAWGLSEGDRERARVLIQNAIYLMEGLSSFHEVKKTAPFVELPESLSEEMIRSTLIVPSIRTLVRINSLNDEDQSKVLNGKTIKELASQIIDDIHVSVNKHIQSMLKTTGTQLSDLNEKQKSITYLRSSNSIKEAYGNILESDFDHMVSTGVYSDLYHQVKMTSDYFFPIIHMDGVEIEKEKETELEAEDEIKTAEIEESAKTSNPVATQKTPQEMSIDEKMKVITAQNKAQKLDVADSAVNDEKEVSNTNEQLKSEKPAIAGFSARNMFKAGATKASETKKEQPPSQEEIASALFAFCTEHVNTFGNVPDKFNYKGQIIKYADFSGYLSPEQVNAITPSLKEELEGKAGEQAENLASQKEVVTQKTEADEAQEKNSAEDEQKIKEPIEEKSKSADSTKNSTNLRANFGRMFSSKPKKESSPTV